MRFLSVCSGIDAPSAAWSSLGWSALAYAEIEAFPRTVLKHRYPDVPLYGDFTRLRDQPWIVDADVLVGGTPCFPGGTLVVARHGLIPIAEIEVGDEVFTHKGRWRRVVATGSKVAATVRLRGQGQSTGVVTTAEHPFYARRATRRWVGREHGSWSREFSAPQWVGAAEMRGAFWASPAAWPASEPPPIECERQESAVPPLTQELAWVIGRWLGDGWTRINKRRGYALICCANREAEDLATRLTAAGLKATRTQERTTTRFQISSRAFARWLLREFGAGAAGKTIPTWVFGWSGRWALLEGYISADGHRVSNGWRIATVSDALALGATLIAHSLGRSASRKLVTPRRSACVIEGRTVRERPFWQVSIYDTARSSVELDGHRWGLVRSVEAECQCEVFNLEVDDDNSYVADGFVVHNCQGFSVAGLRGSLSDDRSNLALEFVRLANAVDDLRRDAGREPVIVLWENVPGTFSVGDNAFGTFLAGLCGHDAAINPPQRLGWTDAGVVSGPRRCAAWRCLDAQFNGLAQRRKRIFVLARQHPRGWTAPDALLPIIESVRWHPAPRREAGQTAPTLPSRSTAGDGLGTDFDCDGGLIAPPLTSNPYGDHKSREGLLVAYGGNNTAGPIEVATAVRAKGGTGHGDFESETFVTHSLRGEDGTGRGTPLVPVPILEAGARTGKSTTDPRAGIGIGEPGDPMFTLQAGKRHAIAYRTSPNNGAWETGDRTDALTTSTDPTSHVIAFEPRERGDDGRGYGRPPNFMEDVSPALNTVKTPAIASFQQNSMSGRGTLGYDAETDVLRPIKPQADHQMLLMGSTVRRLLPVECERLQGFPDNWTKIPWRGRPAEECPDGPRYKALGNSIAVPVLAWIGRRIQKVEETLS